MRVCSKPGCTRAAVATLTYDYRDSTAVLGPLATSPQPHTYDFCEVHAEGLTVPKGWQVVRLQTRFDPAPPSGEDLLALVEAIREVAAPDETDEMENAVVPSTAAPPSSPGPRRPDNSGDYAPRSRRERFTVIPGDGPE